MAVIINKRGAEISLNVMIVVAIALIVLTILVLIFTGRVGFDEFKSEPRYGDNKPISPIEEEVLFRLICDSKSESCTLIYIPSGINISDYGIFQTTECIGLTQAGCLQKVVDNMNSGYVGCYIRNTEVVIGTIKCPLKT